MSNPALFDQEADDLRLHVALCSQRHGQIQGTLAQIEARQKRIEIVAYIIAGALGFGGLFGAQKVSVLSDTVAQAIVDHAPAPRPPVGPAR